ELATWRWVIAHPEFARKLERLTGRQVFSISALILHSLLVCAHELLSHSFPLAIASIHSAALSMRVGSIVAARHAGISIAQQPTTASAIIEGARETGLQRLLSVQATIGRCSITTSANPPPIPSAIVIIADVRISRRMRTFDAPNAMRSANSRVRS